jgi:4-hydroxy-tetrahydrodipicolinate synthase
VVLKTAAGLLGMPAGPARSPVLPLDEAALDKPKKAIAAYPRVA